MAKRFRSFWGPAHYQSIYPYSCRHSNEKKSKELKLIRRTLIIHDSKIDIFILSADVMRWIYIQEEQTNVFNYSVYPIISGYLSLFKYSLMSVLPLQLNSFLFFFFCVHTFYRLACIQSCSIILLVAVYNNNNTGRAVQKQSSCWDKHILTAYVVQLAHRHHSASCQQCFSNSCLISVLPLLFYIIELLYCILVYMSSVLVGYITLARLHISVQHAKKKKDMLYSLADCESRTNYSRGGYCWPSFNFSLLLNEVIIPATTAHRLGAYRIFCVLLTFPFFELCHSVSVFINKPNKRNLWQNARKVQVGTS